MFDNRFRISELFELGTRHIVERIMDRLPLEVLELGHPVSNIVAVWVAFLALCQGVEDSLDELALLTKIQNTQVSSRSMAEDLFQST